MNIFELKNGDVITITLTSEGKLPLVFKSTVQQTSVKNNCALLDPIIVDDKVVNFNTPGIQLVASLPIDGKLMQWRGCVLQYLKNKDKAYHALICKNRGTFTNRRGSFRVPVDEYCYVNNGKATIDALCLNVSNTGFAFVVGKYDGTPMTFVTVTYRDSLLDLDVTLKGKVVRSESKDNGRVIFGCRLLNDCQINKYLSIRQRKLARR